MNNHSLHYTGSFAKAALSMLIVLTLTGSAALRLSAQNTIALHRENTPHDLVPMPKESKLPAALLEAERVRRFDFNPRLQTLSDGHCGDTLRLDFFSDACYRAVVERVVRGGGITGITARIAGSPFGCCYISASEKGISVMAELPEHDARFFVAGVEGTTYLSHYKISDMQAAELGCADAPDYASKKANHIPQTLPSMPDDDPDDAVTIRLLFVYTPAAALWARNNATVTDIDDLIDRVMQISNLSMANSGTGITFEEAYKYQADYMEDNSILDLDYLTEQNDGYMDEIHWLRQQYAADVVVFLPEVSFTGGVAWLLQSASGRPNMAFALCRVQQAGFSHTVVHEIGHTMGCGHHAEQNFQPGPGLFTYSSGWRGLTAGNTSYSTVMTYESGGYFSDGISRPRISYFSSPDILLDGTPIGHPAKADNVLTLKQTKHVTSRYGESLPDLTLSALSVTPGTLAPVFNRFISSYTVEVAASVTAVTVSATAGDAAALLTGTGSKSLEPGLNIMAVTVTAPDMSASRIYTVVVVRGEPVRKSIPMTEDFETSAAGWSVVNEGQPNRWVAGSATAASGTKSMYISNDGGASNRYTITQRNAAHFFCDIAFPAVPYDTYLSFDWQATGEYSSATPWDYLEVRITDAGIIPQPGAASAAGTLTGRYYLASGWQSVEQRLNAAYAGTTRRLVFSWINDDNTGVQPPAAVDNIRLWQPDAPHYSVIFDVRDERTLTPLADAAVTFAGTANPPGQYVFTDIYPGDYAYLVTCAGYRPASGLLSVAADCRQDLRLAPETAMSLTYFALNNGLERTANPSVTLDHTVIDGTPEVYSVAATADAIGAEWLPYAPPLTGRLSGGPGMKELFFAVANSADTSETRSDRILLYTPAELSATLSPNPTKGIVRVGMEHHVSSRFTATVYSLTGEIFFSKEFQTTPFEIDISHCPAGILLVKLSNENRTVTKSIIKY
ncbi:MAG: M12 family metallo-peptidase [Prevotellaceae bacterium]|jgi:hypothetical protein|nr:M12 family metallo-peptidase [Prevotellaceae bacterium]